MTEVKAIRHRLAAKAMRTIRGFLEDRPAVVTFGLLIAVSGYHVAAQLRNLPQPVTNMLRDTPASTTVMIALGLASVAAIAAGFAGAIIVFGISSDSDIMRQFRTKTARALRSNWISVIGGAFAAAALGLISSAFLAGNGPEIASVALLSGAVLLVHSIVRMLWVFSQLLKIVVLQDERNNRATRRLATRDIFRSAA